MSNDNSRELSRRDFIALSALGIAGCAVPGVGGGTKEKDRMLYVGTYTEKTASKGIYLLRLSPGSGALSVDGWRRSRRDESAPVTTPIARDVTSGPHR